MISKVAAFVAVTVVAAAALASAQSTNKPGEWLTPPSGGDSQQGSAVTVTAVLMDSLTMANVNGEDKYGNLWPIYPFMLTVQDLIDAAPSGLSLLQTPINSAQHKPIYNFTATETALIVEWLRAQPAGATNVEVTFAATWRNYRIVIDTASWTRSPSLVPYGVTKTCDVATALTCLDTIKTKLPLQCDPDGINLIRDCFKNSPGCLALQVRNVGIVATLCQTQISIVQGSVCSDTVAGADALCGYIAYMMPSGQPTTDNSVYTSVSNDGMSPDPRVTPPPKRSNAAGVAATLAAAAAVVLAFL